MLTSIEKRNIYEVMVQLLNNNYDLTPDKINEEIKKVVADALLKAITCSRKSMVAFINIVLSAIGLPKPSDFTISGVLSYFTIDYAKGKFYELVAKWIQELFKDRVSVACIKAVQADGTYRLRILEIKLEYDL